MTTSVRISGTTRLFAIVGDPIAQVKSPGVYTALFAERGIDAVMLPAHVLPDRFDESLRGLMALGNLDGLVVTVPYKARMVPFATRLGPTAARIGALNALRREADGSWSGDMFDGAGFVQAAQRKGVALTGRRVALFGAGGAGSAIACELASVGAASVAIIDLAADRAHSLARRLAAAFPACDIHATTQVAADRNMIVNASTVGMRAGDGLPGDIGRLDANTVVGDVVTGAAATPLIRQAIEAGCSTVDGHDMFAGQMEALIHFFRPGAAAASQAANPST
jgi:shikimate dehydrogenase